MSTSAPHEPRIARVAAMMADPARSLMLAYLLSGEYASAGELARAAGVTPATASGHLAKLQDGEFVVCEARGRHRYYRLADHDIAHALEALALVAERSTHERQWSHPERQALRKGRCCYGHLAGRLGVAVFETMLACEGLKAVAGGFELTREGRGWLRSIEMSEILPQVRRRYAYPCLDWSERRDHLGGQLADAIYLHLVGQSWIRRAQGRAVEITALGRQRLLPRLQRPGGLELSDLV